MIVILLLVFMLPTHSSFASSENKPSAQRQGVQDQYHEIFLLQSAILFRVMVSLVPNTLPDLSNKKILLSEGLQDPIVSRNETENLYRLFQKTNANITLKWQNSSHNLIQDDLKIAKEWILNNFH
jgi:predicted esterase